MGALNLNVEIVSANNVGGVYPFVVACLDNDLAHELHKTPATTAAARAIWPAPDNAFTLDLTTAAKERAAAGKPDPTYLTFFLFDTGAPGIPALGSAGVLLATVRDAGVAKGAFPIVNGSGSLSLVVTAEKAGPVAGALSGAADWLHSDSAKTVGKVGAVGLGALAAGLGAMAVSKRRGKNKKKELDGDAADGDAAHAEGGDAAEEGEEHDDHDGAEAVDRDAALAAAAAAAGAPAPLPPPQHQMQHQMQHQQHQQQPYPDHAAAQWAAQQQLHAQQAQMAAPAQYPGQAAGTAARGGAPPGGDPGAPGQRPWWDPETSEEDADEPAGPAGPPGAGPAGYGGYPSVPPGRVNG